MHFGIFGGLAQLGERLTGSQEVSGSIPLFSTKSNECNKNSLLFRSEFLFYTVIEKVPVPRLGGSKEISRG